MSAALEIPRAIDRIDATVARKRTVLVDPASPYTLPISRSNLGNSVLIIASGGGPALPITVQPHSSDSLHTGSTPHLVDWRGGFAELVAALVFIGPGYASSWWLCGTGMREPSVILSVIPGFPYLLPAVANANGKYFRFCNTSGAGNIVVDAGVAIPATGGATTVTIPPFGNLTLYSDGTTWHIVG